jgi:hypothetical protein
MKPNKPQMAKKEAADANKSIMGTNNVRHPIVQAAMRRNVSEGRVRAAVDEGLTVQEADRRYNAAKTSSQKEAASIPVRGGAIRRARKGEAMDLIIGVNPDRNK